MSQILNTLPSKFETKLLRSFNLGQLREALKEADMPLHEGESADAHLCKMRGMYEPYVSTLADRLLMTLPPWIPEEGAQDDWLSSA